MTDHPSLAAALAAVQAELPAVKKTKTAKVEGKDGRRGYEYSYADLAEVSQAVLPLLGRHGLSFSSKPTLDERGQFVLAYVLRHSSGDSDSGTYPLPTGQPQAVGSAISYARRYALCSVTGIAAEDDDDGANAPDVPDVRAPRWDPVEQEQLRDGWEDEIRRAKSDAELDEVSGRIQVAFRERKLSRATVDHLKVAGAARRAELAQEAAA
jgi:hypothetical protein